MVILPAPCDELLGHIVKRHRIVGASELVTGVRGEVWRARKRRRPIDRRQQYKITSRVSDRASAERQTKLVFVKPEAVVVHKTEKVLRRFVRSTALTTHSAAVFTAV